MIAAAAHGPISMFQAVVLGFLQGVTELFPVSSLGHTVLFPTLFGWSRVVRAQSNPESFWLAFVVMLHVGSAIGLLIYFWRDWVAIIAAFFRTLARRQVSTPTERLAWLIIIASIPTGLLGLLLEHPIRVALAKPTAAAVFLVVNGFMLIGAERIRSRASARTAVTTGCPPAPGRGAAAAIQARSGTRRLDTLAYREAGTIGVAQSLALIPGFSRDGVCMTAGLLRGLSNEDAARYAFLLATPIILAAGIFKLGDLTGPLGKGVRAEAVVAAVVAAIGAVFSVHYLMRYFRTRNLIPFGIYCVLFGIAMAIYIAT
jgi:undecaprenyl-diphosphatase